MEDEESRVEGLSAERGILRYCVTGATGYIGSWLVKSLLQRGCTVHATVRDPAKTLNLLPLWGGGDRLRVFRADLREERSFDEAVKGCSGVFHVAASMEFDVPAKEDIDSCARENFIDPAIEGTLNLLKSCSKTASVKRVVFTSSISTLTAKDRDGHWRSIVDESCQNPIDHVWKTKAGAWVYVLSKLLTEETAFKFANENSIDLVSVITTTVTGPFLTPTVPSSVRVLLSPITGDPKFSSILSAVNSRMGSIALVHIEDICSAHIFLMEHARAEGRYICSSHNYLMSELVDRLAKEYRSSKKPSCRLVEKDHGSAPSEISSKKLKDLGFNFKYGVDDIIHQTVKSCVDCGFLSPIVN
ncbi:putative anthocyanidin reductase isoform X1 [Actinidia eriantha]|uniref:putative anthocyanidin reductase isoform X1 n=1 Tax=Actinidia eriantha TaxID=165200 RepID=UPI00258E4E89|nr:putative anthocyanidin reductase isoform X1 [Actinidia eriantha]